MSFSVDLYQKLVNDYFIADYELALVHTSTTPIATTASEDISDSERSEAVFWVGKPEHDTVIHALSVEEGYAIDPILGTQLIVVKPGDQR